MNSDAFEGWFDMRDLGPVLEHEEPLPIRQAIRRSKARATGARRHRPCRAVIVVGYGYGCPAMARLSSPRAAGKTAAKLGSPLSCAVVDI
jgi:hypothetical protein